MDPGAKAAAVVETASSTDAVSKIILATDYGSWFWFILITIAFSVIWYGILQIADIAEITRNWPKYRCSPSVMPFASLYGYNTTENFNYCMQSMISSRAGAITGPFAGILGTMIQNMMTVLNSLNSLRTMIATMVGGVGKMFQEFVQRFKVVMAQVRIASLRMQMIFRRLFGTFYSVIYMGTSLITAGQNFGDTVIFKFLDTFCFAPETIIGVKRLGRIAISDVHVGDILDTGETVTSTYQFAADGQPMVRLYGTIVSTNHFVEYNSELIEAGSHPAAVPLAAWSGGYQRPLICLDTSTHRIPLGGIKFSDWDETSDSDTATMILAEKRLNGFAQPEETYQWAYQPAVDPTAQIILADGSYLNIEHIVLGDELSFGRVVGLGWRVVNQVCQLPDGHYVTPSQLIWDKTKWVRAGHIYTIINRFMKLRTLVIMQSGSYELANGFILRDMCEVHTPDMEVPTRHVLQRPTAH